MEKMKWIKKGISALLALNMVLSSVPLPAFAVTTDNLCDHHTEHTAECSYREGSAGSACTHEHSEGCYKIVACKHTHDDTCSSGCSHTCTVESGCITMELDCHHTHGDCGYAEAVAPQECTTCQSVLTHAENCGYVAPVAEVTCDCVPGEDGTLVHTEGCGYVAPVAEVKCACQPTVTHGGEGCTYVEGKAGSPCTHTHAVKVDSADSCYKLLCSHKDGGHDDVCGYAQTVEAHDCHYECSECAIGTVSEEGGEADPTCTCGTEADIHTENCPLYAAPSVTAYTVTIVEGIENGTVTAEPTSAEAGVIVTLTVTPDEGYVLDTLTVKQGETEVTVTDNTFTMPAGNVTVTAAFKACDHTSGEATCVSGPLCEVCGASYGEVDTTNHDSTVQFDNNGFCPHCNTFQPATLNEEGCYEISNAGQLYWFAEKVNGGANDINAILMENITINEKVLDAEGNLIADPSGLRQWTPIGHYLSADDFYSFDGIFDGNGKTITGLYHNDSYARYAGLFGYSTGTIQYLTLADTYINTTRSDGRAGSVAGLNEGTVRNCHLVSGYVSGNSQIGGIVGRMNAGSIEDCTNTGTVNSAANNAGGICGHSSAGSIDGCTNHGAISGEQHIGGISGWLAGRIQNSCNYGTIVGTSCVGGIVGTTDGGDVTNCYNAGSVEATSELAGGILGYLQKSPTISYCYNSGMIQSPKDVGSIVGHVLDNSNVKATIVNCYNDNTVFTGNFVGINGGSYGKATITNCSGMTTEEFASGKVTYLLNGGSSEGVWKQALGTDTYPGFGGGTVYYGNCPKDHYSNNAEEVKNHNLANGICTDCGDYDVPVQNAEGYYEIYTAGQLYWFAELVNSGDYDANAIVMADIDLGGNVWTTITSTDLYYNTTTYSDAIYSGTFDGNGHVIRNFTVQGINGAKCAVGLFGSTKGATIQNLGVDNMTFQLNGATDVRAAAIVGQMLHGSVVENCYVVNSTLTPNNYIVGGIAACNYGGTIRNCFTRNVTISANSRCGNLVSDCRGDISNTDRPGTVTNCWTDADRVVGTQNVAANITDCHTNAEDALKSGEAAYNLGSAFGQTIGTDTYPVFDGATVYQVENIGCSVFGEYGYSNTNEPVSPEHQYTNGFCDCGDYGPAELKNDVYQIANAGNLFWLAEQRITGTISAFNAQLTADIVIPDDKVWTPFVSGDGSTFDGGGHSIAFNQASGLFTSFNYSTLKNLILKGSVTANTTDYVGAVAASAFASILENVISYVDVTNGGNGPTGGLVGYFGGKPQNGYGPATIRNCAVYADISGTGDVGGIIGRGWGGTQYYRFYNSAYVGSVTGGTNTGALVGYNATGNGSTNPSVSMSNIRFEYCYYCPQNDTIPMVGGSFKYDGIGVEGYAPITNCAYKSAEQFASGEVAYLLNGSSTDENVVWRQNVGSDSYPTFSGRVVWYQNDKYANDIIRVSISWTEMSFTYTDGQWDPETHTYGDGGWTADAGLGKITVTNIGGLIFPVKFSFTSTMAGVEGSFDIVDAALANNASITSTLSISGTPSETSFVDKQIGTVTVTIGKCDWEVGDTVNYVAIDGNTYETTVAALTENSAVLACWAAYDDIGTSQKNYLDPVGARHIVRDSAEWNNYLYPWINANRGKWVVYLSSNDKRLCLYKLNSAGLPTYGAAEEGDANIFYAWDITFAN